MLSVRREPFGVTDSGEPVRRHVLSDGSIEVALLDWGATVQSLTVPDRSGRPADVVLGFDELSGYTGEHPYFGAVVGRYANRIRDGRFQVDGAEHRIPLNDRGHALHGGPDGFHRKVWAARTIEAPDRVAVEFTHVSPHGSMGFPGTLEATVTYTVRESSVRVDYRAATDRPTIVNLTQHTYFNLGGSGSGSVDGHRLRIAGSRYVPVDAESIPLEATLPVAGTPFDFREPKPIGRDIRQADEQLARGAGYDHSWLLDHAPGAAAEPGTVAGPGAATGPGSVAERRPVVLAARVSEPASGRVLEVLTDEPAVQFYSGNKLDGSLAGKAGTLCRQGDGFCLETQHPPDSPNRPDFPSVTLRPGEEYTSTTIWAFTTQ